VSSQGSTIFKIPGSAVSKYNFPPIDASQRHMRREIVGAPRWRATERQFTTVVDCGDTVALPP
jgi:hypothetical protein